MIQQALREEVRGEVTMATGALAGLAAGDEGIQKLLLDPKCTAIESFIRTIAAWSWTRRRVCRTLWR